MNGGLRYKLVSALLESNNKAIEKFVLRDLLGKQVVIEELWQLLEPQKILRKQRPDGSWEYPSKKVYGKKENYNQYETFNKLGILVEKYGFNKSCPEIRKTADYFFSVQSEVGDFRGIYDQQYTPNYTAGITELLIKAGYEDDSRIERIFNWLISIRQLDGGWALPFRTRNFNIDVTYSYPTTIQPDKSKPFSPMVTGVVLRGFAAHPKFKKSDEAKKAAALILPKFFKSDPYPDRKGSEYWSRFTFPFCYTDLISAMDSLSLLGFSRHDPHIVKVLEYFIQKQQENGLWNFRIVRGSKKEITQLWLALAVGKIFKRMINN